MASASASTSASASSTYEDYTLRYCYTFERGFDTAYSLCDIVLYRTNGTDTAEVEEYLRNEDAWCDKEEEQKMFFMTRQLSLPARTQQQRLMMVALYPDVKEEADDEEQHVVNLVITNLNDEDEEDEERLVLERVVREAEAQGIKKYKVVEIDHLVIEVSSSIEEEDDD